MLFARKPKRRLGIKKALAILLVLCMSLFLSIFVYGWQADNGDGTFNNPPLYADYPDPSIIRVGNYFYMASSTFVNVPGLVILRSEDLVNWEIAGHCISSFTGDSKYNMEGGTKYGNGCFAPSIAYKNGTFYVAVTPNGERTRIYYAKDVAGPWNYNTLGGSYFDPCLFIDDDGSAYLAYGGAWENQIRMVQLNSDLSATVGSPRVILSYKNVEGTHLVKANGRYYLFNAVPAQRLVCSRANNVWGPYGETITLCTAGKGGHQGGIVDLPDGSYWGYLHQDDGAIGRPTRICPITWQNGWPMFGRPGYIGQVESRYTKPIQNKPIKVPATSDEFNSETLGLQWAWNHNPDNSKWALTGSTLRLKATTGKDFWNARNSLTQKGQGPISTGTIKIDCSGMQPGDICGLGMLGDPRGYIAVTRDPKRIIMTEEDVVKATVNNITSNILYFRLEMNFITNKARFFWRDDNRDWQQLGPEITMGFDWQFGTFQGEQYAILNFNPNGSNGYVDVDWFRLNDVPGPTPQPTTPPAPRDAFTKIEAETYNNHLGIQTEKCSEGGEDIGYIENGDFAVYKNVDFGNGAASFEARVASATSGGKIELRIDSINGPLIGTCTVAGTGDWQKWSTVTCDVSEVKGNHDLYLVFTGGNGYLFNINWFTFNKKDNAYASPQRGRPRLNAARTTFVGDNGQPLRGPFTSTEWTAAAPYDQIARVKELGFNAVHLYAECFDPKYPAPGSNAPGYAVNEIDKIVERTRELGLYLVITIGNGANNGNHNAQWARDFWKFYAPRYAKETHVLYEIHNEPVAWGPPYSSSTANPPGAVDMEIDVYRIIRTYAPETPVLLFSYAVFGGKGGAAEALKDIRAFNKAVFGNENAVWTNEAVAFHGYAGWQETTIAVEELLKAGYPCFMTEYAGGAWGSGMGGLDVELTYELERLGVSWLTFQYIPPTGVSDDVTKPEYFSALVENSGLSWTPDYGNWPAARGVYGNGGLARETATWINNFLTGTTRIEAEDFDWGGNGVSYYDTDSVNVGGQYRPDEGVDIEKTSDTGGGYNVGWISEGEWLEYTIRVRNPGYYNLSLRVAGISGSRVQVSFGNQDKTGVWELPATGGFQTWTTATRQVFLGAGLQKLRINALSGGFNLNWIELSPISTGTIPDGTYKFLNRANGKTLQEVTGNNSIITADYKGITEQHWKIQHIGGGQYRISSAGRGWNWNWWMGFGTVGWWGTGSNTCFIISPTGDGYYRIVLVGDGTNLQISSGDPSKIEGKAFHGGANQQWAILPVSAPAFPTGLSAVLDSSGNTANLTWNAAPGANSYNVKRSTKSGGPYTTIATNITSTNYTDTGVATGTKYYYVVSAVSNGVETLNSAEAILQYPKLTGTVIGTQGSWNNIGNTIHKAFDGDLNTFFDGPTANGCWLGLDFGEGVRNVITQIKFCPRSGHEQRMIGGIFQGANKEDFSDAVTLFTITSLPGSGTLTSVDVDNPTGFRYVRYLSPDGSNGNIAELQFFGTPAGEENDDVHLGDINDDGNINSVDLHMIERHLLGSIRLTEKQLLNADVNRDGRVDSIDLALLIRYILGVITTL